jgi:hypothetical protein
MDGIPCATLAGRLGLSATARGNWAEKFDLCAPPETAGQLDVIEHCVVAAIRERVPRDDQVSAWNEIRPHLRQLAGVLDAVVGKDRRVHVTHSDEELADAVRQATPLGVVDLASAIRNGRAVWAQWAGPRQLAPRGKPHASGSGSQHARRRPGG